VRLVTFLSVVYKNLSHTLSSGKFTPLQSRAAAIFNRLFLMRKSGPMIADDPAVIALMQTVMRQAQAELAAAQLQVLPVLPRVKKSLLGYPPLGLLTASSTPKVWP
jgi:hypothetical protein